MRNCRRVGETELLSTRSYPDPSEPVTKGRNSDIKGNDHESRCSELTERTVLVHGRRCVCWHCVQYGVGAFGLAYRLTCSCEDQKNRLCVFDVLCVPCTNRMCKMCYKHYSQSLTQQQKVRTLIVLTYCYRVPVPVAARSKASVCGRSLAGIAGSNPAWGMDVCLLWVLCVVR